MNKSSKKAKGSKPKAPKQVKVSRPSAASKMASNRNDYKICQAVNGTLMRKQPKIHLEPRLGTDPSQVQNTARFKKIGCAAVTVAAKDCCTPDDYISGKGNALTISHPCYMPTFPVPSILCLSKQGIMYSFDKDLYQIRNLFVEPIVIVANTPAGTFDSPLEAMTRKYGFHKKGGPVDRVTIKPGEIAYYSIKKTHFGIGETPIITERKSELEDLSDGGLERHGMQLVVMIPKISDQVNAAIDPECNIVEINCSTSGRFTEVEPALATGISMVTRSDEGVRVFNGLAEDLKTYSFFASGTSTQATRAFGFVDYGRHLPTHYLYSQGIFPPTVTMDEIRKLAGDTSGRYYSAQSRASRFVLVQSDDTTSWSPAKFSMLEDVPGAVLQIPALGVTTLFQPSSYEGPLSNSQWRFDGVYWSLYSGPDRYVTERKIFDKAGHVSNKCVALVSGLTISDRDLIQRKMNFYANPLNKGLEFPKDMVFRRDWLATLQTIVQTVTTVAQVVGPIAMSFV
jgi:hypothetical protein